MRGQEFEHTKHWKIEVSSRLFIFPNVIRLYAGREFHLSILDFELISLKLSY